MQFLVSTPCASHGWKVRSAHGPALPDATSNRGVRRLERRSSAAYAGLVFGSPAQRPQSTCAERRRNRLILTPRGLMEGDVMISTDYYC